MDELALGAALRIENNFGQQSYYNDMALVFEGDETRMVPRPLTMCLHGAIAAEAVAQVEAVQQIGMAVNHSTVAEVAQRSSAAFTDADVWGDPTGPLARAAVLARQTLRRVIAVLPREGDCCDHRDVLRSPGERVYHWNDEHCDGGVKAAKVLREAAEVELP